MIEGITWYIQCGYGNRVDLDLGRTSLIMMISGGLSEISVLRSSSLVEN